LGFYPGFPKVREAIEKKPQAGMPYANQGLERKCLVLLFDEVIPTIHPYFDRFVENLNLGLLHLLFS
jgi:hypothetical protein